ncbi:MAG: formate dehydrogenase accessory protein FdhE [Nitrospiraceae bacterium]|nr:formate dehydrogenase accessory protein FdhE [Nitrospiraceae bacterium]
MTTDVSVLDKWIAAHPYLKEAADFEKIMSSVLDSSMLPDIEAPDWDAYTSELSAGVPLLRNDQLNERVFEQASRFFSLLVSGLANMNCNEVLRSGCAELYEKIQHNPGIALNLVKEAAAGREDGTGIPVSVSSGTIRFLGWRAIERANRSWRSSLENRLLDSDWNRAYCPFCGNPPSMAQLIHTSNGRQKFLSCGCCRTRWKYLRMSCAFCENHDQNRLDILEPENNEDLRLDICRQCNSYIKTYTNEGEEDIMLADWSSLHLDVIASESGLHRRAHSLYEL